MKALPHSYRHEKKVSNSSSPRVGSRLWYPEADDEDLSWKRVSALQLTEGNDMSNRHVSDHPGLEIIVRSPDSVLDEIVLKCPDLTWNQLFVVIDRLSREGVLTMSPKGRGQYALTFRCLTLAHL